MTLTSFLRQCQEMVETRWVATFVGSNRAIRLVLVVDQATETNDLFPPIVAVGVDLFGSLARGGLEEGDIAEMMGLKAEVAFCIQYASCGETSVEPLMTVRTGLIEAVSRPNGLLHGLSNERVY